MGNKREGTQLIGTVKNVVPEKGFGFILVDGGSEEFFFHYTACKTVRFDSLSRGSRVKFVAGSGAKGPRAEEIEAL